MTHDRDFKRLVRRRMHKTGESYASARAQLLRAYGLGAAAPTRSGGAAVLYPFEKFTDPAKRALSQTQLEAETSHAGAITTSHLLLGLLHDEDTMAVRMLDRLAPRMLVGLLHDKAPQIRRAIDRQPEEGSVSESGDLVPSDLVKEAIELAFRESQLVGDGTLGTGHLLMGVLGVGTSSGARAMGELGVTADAARAALRELSEPGVVREPSTPERKPPARDYVEWVEAAQVLARTEGSSAVRADHLLRAAPRSPAVRELFARLGIDLTAVPPPPARLAEIEEAALPEQRDEWERVYAEWVESWR